VRDHGRHGSESSAITPAVRREHAGIKSDAAGISADGDRNRARSRSESRLIPGAIALDCATMAHDPVRIVHDSNGNRWRSWGESRPIARRARVIPGAITRDHEEVLRHGRRDPP
jgi:hypothetical protein